MSYESDRTWSDQFIPAIRGIVGPLLMIPSSDEIDMKQAADLLVLKARDMRIACRVRRYGFANKYPYDFTIRAQRDNGAATELEKIVNGWGDWMFYGHAGEGYGEIIRWMVIDLHAWRAHAIMAAGRKIGVQIANGDGTHFRAYDVTRFGPVPPITIADSFGFTEGIDQGDAA